MAKNITIQKHQTLEEIESEIKSTHDGRYRLRLQAIYLAMQKMHSHQICSQLMISKQALFKWIKWSSGWLLGYGVSCGWYKW